MKTIIELYEEANGWNPAGFDRTVQDLERFAALVRADEREAVVQLIKELRPAIRPLEGMGVFMTTEEWFAVLVENIRARGNT